MIPMIAREAAARLNRAAIGLRKRYEVDVLARKYRPKFTRFFLHQKTLTLGRFKDYRFLFTEEYRTLREETRPNEFLTTHDWDGLWQDIDRATFDDLQKIIAQVEGEGVLKGAAFGLNQIGTITPDSPTFSLANPRAVQWFMDYGGSLSYITDIQYTTRDQLQAVITKAIDEGWSYNQTAKVLSSKFDGFSRERATRIAVHESAQAYEAGNRMFADSISDDGVEMEKMWMTSHDDKVSDGCAENESDGWIPITDMHTSGHQQPPRFPGCRCYEIYRQAGKGS